MSESSEEFTAFKAASLRVRRNQRDARQGARGADRRHRSGDGQPGRRHAARGGQQADRGGAQRAQSPLFAVARHSAAAGGDHPPVPGQLRRGARSRYGSHRHHRRQGRAGAPAVRHRGSGRRGGLAESRVSHPSVRRDHGRRPRLHAADARCRHVSQPAGGLYTAPRTRKAQAAADLLPAQPHHHLRGPGFLPRDRAPGARSTAP